MSTIDYHADPAVLDGRTVIAVKAERHYDDDEDSGWSAITLELDDGRVFVFGSCSCCGGGGFCEVQNTGEKP